MANRGVVALGRAVLREPARAAGHLLRLARTHRTYAAMAAAEGVSRRTMIRWCKRLEITVERLQAAGARGDGVQSAVPGLPVGRRVEVPLLSDRPVGGYYQPAYSPDEGAHGWRDLPDGTRLRVRLARFPGGQLKAILERSSQE